MAYWSSTEFDHYAAEDDLRNVKPRWQELAELAEIYSSPFSTLSTPTAPKANRNIGHMDRRIPGYSDGDNGLWSKHLRANNDSNVASIGASRSRSRSRSRTSRPRTRMFETPTAGTQRRSKTIADPKYQHAHSKQKMLAMLLALVIALLSWFGISAFRFSNLTGMSIPNAVWMPQNESIVAEVKEYVCNPPMVPRVLDCDQLSDPEASRTTRSVTLSPALFLHYPRIRIL